MNRWKAKILYWILGDFLIELQGIDMMPELKGAVRAHLQNQEKLNYAIRELVAELKLLRVTGRE